jgi:glycosyltransferase involved in cell wall biosynthesis
MKILHISASDKTGGASIAAFRLHNAMFSAGIDSKYLVLNRTINDRVDIVTVSKYSRYIRKIINIVLENITTKNMRKIKGLYSSFKYGINISKRHEITEADVIYLHWINSFVNYRELKKILKTGKPVFWFMHDMFPITGGCHYSFDCTNYQTQCRKCPYHGKGIDQSVHQYKAKEKIYKQFDNLMFIAPSKWLFDCVKKSGLTRNKQVFHIPNLIDTTVFKPVDKSAARELFSLNNNISVIGFGANSALTNPYKGWDYLKDAFHFLSKDETLQETKIEILIFGSSYSKEMVDSLPFPVHFIGHLHDDYSLVMAYNCINIFVIPSLAEAFGQTIIESLACNVPVVGFNIGGIPDMVNEYTGYLAEYKNSEDLAKGITVVLKEGKTNVREYVKSFSLESIVDKHKEMWNIEGFQ